MKFNVEIELDYIEEDGSVDDEVKFQLINGIFERLQVGIKEDIKKKVEEKTLAMIDNEISDKVQEVFNDFTNKEISVTDQFGDVVKSYKSIIDMIKEKFDGF